MDLNNYIKPYEGYFWTWEGDEQEDVLTIGGGSTIAYSSFLLQIMGNLSEQGLPPFGALLLAIIATNHSMEDHLREVKDIILQSINQDKYNETGIKELLQEAMSVLTTLTRLPEEYTKEHKRIQLFQLLFADCHHKVSVPDSKNLVAHARKLLSEPDDYEKASKIIIPKAPYSYENFYRDFKCIALLGRRFPDVKSIVEQLANVPDIREPLLIDDPSNKKPVDLVQGLIDHQETFQVGSLIKNLWSALNIPIHHSLPCSQPLGGVSDLSNKGDFDRLLISEFANDDLIFLSRLANQEALYLNREIPPMADQQERVILLDISLRSWGTPKLLAYAILLAIAHHPRTDIHCTAFALGDSYYPLAFNTVGEVIDSLHILDASLHPAAGLTSFFTKYYNSRKLEIFFISSPDTIRLPAMQKAISDHRAHIKYWVMVGPEGGIDLHKMQNNVKKLVQEIRLPLQELWKPKKREILFIQQGEAFSAMDIPILFPPSAGVKKVMIGWGEEVFLIDNDQKLFRVNPGQDIAWRKGWELMGTDIPKSADYVIGNDKNGGLVLLCFNKNKKEIILLGLVKKETQKLHFPEWGPSGYKDFFWYNRCFYYMNEEYCWKIHGDPPVAIHKHEASPSEVLIGFYQDRERKLVNLSNRRPFQNGGKNVNQSLKRIDKVFINGAGNLVFNKHELKLESNGDIHLTLASAENREPVLSARWNSAGNNFLFSGGSSVALDRSGILILKSSPTGQAGLYEVILRSKGPNTLNTIKAIKDHTGLGLKESSDLIAQSPSVVNTQLTRSQAEAMKEALISAGGDAVVKRAGKFIFMPTTLQSPLGLAAGKEFAGNDFYYIPMHGKGLIKTNTKAFYQDHILAYIQEIQTHGA